MGPVDTFASAKGEAKNAEIVAPLPRVTEALAVLTVPIGWGELTGFVEHSVNRVPAAVSVNDDEKLINLLKMLVNVVRSLIASRQTPAALAAEQLLEALVPVLDGLH